MTTTFVYPGTFDPITNGHIDLIKRALPLCNKLIVAIAKDTQKKPLFSQKQRVTLAKEALKGVDRIEVLPFSGFLVDFAEKHNAKAILRGLRVSSDFEYEFQLAGVNRRLNPQIETIFLTPSDQHAYTSSSMVRWIAELGGDITQFAPTETVKALQNFFTKTS